MKRLALLAFALAALPALATPIVVYKDASCGCCAKWIAHMEAHGFQASVSDSTDMASIKARLGVPVEARSCHTAVVGGYVIEGHVPAADVKRLLATRPKATGLAVPGMPMGSPGMEGPRRDAYEVFVFQRDGSRGVFARH